MWGKSGGSLARNVAFDAPTSPYLWGKLQSTSFLKVSRQVVMSFCVATWHFVTFQHVSCQKWFCVAGAILLPRFQKMRCIFRGRRSTLKTSHVILRGRRSTFDVSCCVFFANRIVTAARSGDTHYSTLYTLHSHFCTPALHSTLYKRDSTLHALHSTLHTFNFKLSTSHFTLHTLHFTLHIFYFTLYTLHSTLYTHSLLP